MPRKKKETIVGFVLDETGSMEEVKDATVGGFNEYLNSLKKKGDSVSFTLIKFNSNNIKTIHSNVPVSKAKLLTDKTYNPDAMTPLYDAIANGIKTIESKSKQVEVVCETCKERFKCYTDGSDIRSKCTKMPSVLFVIMTDGLENASRQYNREKIVELIKEREGKGWTFAYLGANQDAWEVGTSMGIRGGSTMTYTSTDVGTRHAYGATVMASDSYFSKGSSIGQSAGFFAQEKTADELISEAKTITDTGLTKIKIPKKRKGV